jgi:hypothetical protein
VGSALASYRLIPVSRGTKYRNSGNDFRWKIPLTRKQGES